MKKFKEIEQLLTPLYDSEYNSRSFAAWCAEQSMLIIKSLKVLDSYEEEDIIMNCIEKTYLYSVDKCSDMELFNSMLASRDICKKYLNQYVLNLDEMSVINGIDLPFRLALLLPTWVCAIPNHKVACECVAWYSYLTFADIDMFKNKLTELLGNNYASKNTSN